MQDKKRTFKQIKESTFEVKQISKGNNNPVVDISKNNLDLLLIALHYEIPLNEIEKNLNWEKAVTESRISVLLKNQLLKKSNDIYIPSIGIFTLEKGKVLIEKSQKIAFEIAEEIEKIIPKIKEIHLKMDISQKYSFSDLSFFYLSNILLDMGQIENVEKKFLKKQRPMRNGKRYYLAILEKDIANILEPFGIYGNQGLENNKEVYIGVYGNTRTKLNTDWDDYKNKEIHFFNKKDFDIFYVQMPTIFLPVLIDILERNRAFFKKVYIESHYDKEITFSEFFIWWYHFIYTEATDKLIKDGIIQKPKNGLFYYKVQK